MLRRRALSALAATAALPHAVRAQTDFPTKSVRIVVPFAPGGTTDHVSRLVANELATMWGQSVVVENKPGARTMLGVGEVAKARGDGYSLVTITGSYTFNEALNQKMTYNGRKDLRPVAMMAISDHVLVVNPQVPARHLREFLALAKANPGKYAYASFGNGSSAHLSAELLELKTGIDLIHVPYKGQAPALADVIGGQVHMMFANLPEALPQIQAGRVRALGLAATQRSPLAPEVPTLAEEGVPELTSNSWSALLAPAATADAVVTKINRDVNAALGKAAVREAMDKSGIAPRPGTPEALGEFLRKDIALYEDLIRKTGLKID